MWKKQARRFRIIKPLRTLYMIAVGVCICVIATAMTVQAQSFADLKSSIIDYSKTDNEPVKSCEIMSSFKSSEIVQITAVNVSAADNVPAFCRVTGMLDP
ncbi:MAG TPA: hypothetical protein VJ373_03760, partial [Desulfatiglandales bacterium]|nr:hypothetical protein [Desulfatiglandales bacterium]